MSAELVVLISGRGSNLKAILEACRQGKIAARVRQVLADRDCPGLAHAQALGIATAILDKKKLAEALLSALNPRPDLIVLAGFLSILPREVIAAFPQSIINLHPSLLPKFGGAGMYGLRVHQAVIQSGAQESGCTVHYVDEGIDSGAIIAQARVPVLAGDSPESLAQRVQAQEHALLCDSIAHILSTRKEKS